MLPDGAVWREYLTNNWREKEAQLSYESSSAADLNDILYQTILEHDSEIQVDCFNAA
jgi:hypothetical protein